MTKRLSSGTVRGPKYSPPQAAEPVCGLTSISGGLLTKESLVSAPLTITPGSSSRHCTVSPSVAMTRLTKIFLVLGRSPAAATRFCIPRTMTLDERSTLKPTFHASGPSKTTTSPGSGSEKHTSELQSRFDLVCRLLLEKKKKKCKC